jgi:archaeal flagellin FlaB
MSPLKQNDEGFTGLEAAIVLIAFVVVAAVFSYVVLGAGFFTTQKAQETVHTSVQQASSTVEVIGNVYGTASTGTTQIKAIRFSLGLAAGGTTVDFDKAVMTYSTASDLQTLAAAGGSIPQAAAAGKWAITAVHNQITTDNSLQTGEQFDITVMPTNKLSKNTKFSVEVKPSVGAAFDITRTTPPSIETVNLLY